jgi:hypothetical protein
MIDQAIVTFAIANVSVCTGTRMPRTSRGYVEIWVLLLRIQFDDKLLVDVFWNLIALRISNKLTGHL